MESSFKSLNLKRASIKGRVTKFSNYLDDLKGCKLVQTEVNILTQKLGKIEALFVEFDGVQNQIEGIDENNLSIELDMRESIEQAFHNSIATAQELIADNTVKKSSLEHGHSFATADEDDSEVIGFRLPIIKISNFDGTYYKWLEFRDTFSSLIHNNSKIKNIHKFHYLNSYLEGEAARVISNLQVTDNNYPEAWNLLCERYNNVRQLINNHIKLLLNFEQARESNKSLRFVVDHVTKNLRALHTLKQPTEHWDTLIIYLVAAKLDNNTRVKWEEYIHANVSISEMPTLDDFMTFLKARADVLESVFHTKQDQSKNVKSAPNYSHNSKQPHTSQSTKSFVVGKSNDSNVSTIYKCVVCSQDHRIYECPQFIAKSIDERVAQAAKLKLCINCLRGGHNQRICRVLGSCKNCRKRHSTLLCPSSQQAIKPDNSESVAMSATTSSETLLCTALVDVVNPLTNKSITTRALLDSGSQCTFISQKIKDQLSLKSMQSDIQNVIGIGNVPFKLGAERCNIRIQSKLNSFSIISSCLVIPVISGKLPKSFIDTTHLDLKSFELADPSFYEPAEIGLLIGADIFWDILLSKQHTLGQGNPILRESKLGWLIAGPMHYTRDNNKTIQCHLTNVIHDEPKNCLTDFHNDLKKFWELESLPRKPLLTDQEKDCEQHFLKHTKRNEEGRFCVKLPLTDEPNCLGDTYFMAKTRFLNLERRFRKQPEIKSAYVEFINEYAHLGHLSISEVDRPENGHFIPHHPVIRDNSESTRLRVVFDASARTAKSGISLNDIQMIGPTIQDSLFNILLRFRQYRYVLSADIEKMYRQILVHESDRNLQLILWRDAEDKPLKTLRLNTVTYGFASASFLATRCLWQIGEECNDPVTKNIIQTDFYVDDLLTGHDDEEQLLFIQRSVAKNLAKAGFNLRKYRSNSPSLLFSDNLQASGNLRISETSNTLGLSWDPSSDILKFPIIVEGSNAITKRTILSTTFKIYDPLGLLSLCTIVPKILIQTLWSLKLDWDDPAPKEIVKSWKTFVEGLQSISSLTIPRLALITNPINIEMHCFCDASQRAYGACIYLRSMDQDGQVHVKLLCAKSRVAPASTPTTIPRLELSGALLAAEMSSTVSQALRCKISRTVYWTDSSIVLAWLRVGSKNLKTFVANRVAAIRELTETASWHHVSTKNNPADLLSRGLNPQEVASCNLWWFGPDFLSSQETDWPVSQSWANMETNDLPEVKAHIVEAPDVKTSFINIEKYSKLKTLQHILAYINRFVHNCRNPKSKLTGCLSVSELDKALNKLVYISQTESFPKELKILQKGKSLNPKSNIAALNPFLHEELIRVGGRIRNSNFSFDMKHPLLLSSKHHLTKLLFEQEHRKLLHAGPQALLASIRTRFWPINGRNLARRIALNCNVCRRFQGQVAKNIMGNLPSERLTPDFPFNIVGTDFAGPFMITDRKGRGCKITKCYLCIFICFKYKCIHLEAVSELSKNAFKLSLIRFISRRGIPRKIYSDNGGNYVATATEIKEFLSANANSIHEFAASEGVEFCFSPPYAPHFNGLMEAGVKSAKFHLTRILGNTHLTFEELTSLLTQIEAILNSRPLYPLSSSPHDFYHLTPGHFLIGRPLKALPSPCLQDYNVNHLDRFQRIEQLKQHFWRRWSLEYISELQTRSKWRIKSRNLHIGDLVVLKEDNSPPLCWRLGRIQQLFPGPDGIARVANINTSRGVVRRALNRICLLPNPEAPVTAEVNEEA